MVNNSQSYFQNDEEIADRLSRWLVTKEELENLEWRISMIEQHFIADEKKDDAFTGKPTC